MKNLWFNIAQAGVALQGKSIGRRLMECVISHYPAQTEFFILTRIFNLEARNLYHNRLGFSPISKEEVVALGYDERYCGFNHTTSSEEVALMQKKQQRVEPKVAEPIKENNSLSMAAGTK